MYRIYIRILLLAAVVTALPGAMEYRPVSPGQPFPYILGSVYTPLEGTGPHEAGSADVSAPLLCATYDRPYGLKELEASRLTFGMPAGPFGIHLTWDRFGIEGYRENSLHLGVSFQGGSFFSLGSRGSFYSIDAEGGGFKDQANYWEGGFSCTLNPFSWLSLGGAAENVYAMTRGGTGYIEGQWSCGITLKPRQGLYFSGNVSRIPGGYITSFAAGANLLKYLALEGGYSRETSSGSFAAVFLFKNLAVSYSLRYHPNLGCSHAVTLQIRKKPARLLPFRYGKIHDDEPALREQIDIRTCSLEALQGVPVLKKPYPRRIIRYRELIGPVTVTALEQLGMRGREIARLHRYVTGIRKKEKSYYKKGSKGPGRYKALNRKRKACFAALVESGATSYRAMTIARSLPGRKLLDVYLSELSPDEKKKAGAACYGK